MFISCAAAAPTRHPPGEAHAAPRTLLPLTTRLAQVAALSGYLGGAAARGSTTMSPIEQPLSPCRLASTRQATSQLQPAQQLRPGVAKNASGRHQTTRDSAPPGTPGWRTRLPGRRCRRRLDLKQPNRSPPVALSPPNNTTGDAPTPTHPTTSACCRQKRIRATPGDTRQKKDRPAAGSCR